MAMGNRTNKGTYGASWQYASLGIEMCASVAIGVLGGQWLDQKFGTEPWLLLFGMVVGMGAAIKAIVRTVKALNRTEKL